MGAIKSWTQDQVSKFPKMLEAISLDEIPAVNVKLVAKLDDKKFIDIDFTIDPKAFPGWIEKIGESIKDGVEWSMEKKKHIADEMKKAWGDVSKFTKDQIEK